MGFKKIIVSILICSLIAKVSSINAKPGTCPALTVGPCVQECSTDADCDGVKKCCPNPCGAQCFTPVELATPKPGTCHVIQKGEVGICAFTCDNDESCRGSQKCCPTACGGTVCEQPTDVPPKPGTCPIPGDSGICAETCFDDYSCKGDDKCCKTACGGTICSRPVPVSEKPGQCPAVGPFEGAICESICETDYDCAGTQKCCKNSCRGTYCVEPTSKEGECPAPIYTDPEKCPLVKFKECDGDLTCPDDLKCCCTGCNFVCTKPVKPIDHKPPCSVKQGTCPAPWFTQQQCQLIKFAPCGQDSDCKGDLKCCFNGCGFSCTERFKKKGECPVTPLKDCVCERIDFWCQSDDCCGGDLKCCDNGCGTSCVKPVDQTPRPGVCPVALTIKTNNDVIDCQRIKCKFDSECNQGLKCCSNFCGGTECTFI